MTAENDGGTDIGIPTAKHNDVASKKLIEAISLLQKVLTVHGAGNLDSAFSKTNQTRQGLSEAKLIMMNI